MNRLYLKTITFKELSADDENSDKSFFKKEKFKKPMPLDRARLPAIKKSPKSILNHPEMRHRKNATINHLE